MQFAPSVYSAGGPPLARCLRSLTKPDTSTPLGVVDRSDHQDLRSSLPNARAPSPSKNPLPSAFRVRGLPASRRGPSLGPRQWRCGGVAAFCPGPRPKRRVPLASSWKAFGGYYCSLHDDLGLVHSRVRDTPAFSRCNEVARTAAAAATAAGSFRSCHPIRVAHYHRDRVSPPSSSLLFGARPH